MESGEVASDRRKACDLCSKKKIKCDQLRPTCSNCRLYKAECRTTPVKRKVVPAASRKPVPASQGLGFSAPERCNRVDALEDRLANIETQLQQFISLASAAFLDKQASPRQPERPPPARSMPAGFTPSSHAPTNHGNPTWTPDTFSSDSPPVEVRRKEEQRLELPPLEEILPVIDSYFHNYNSVTPLFQRSSFMRILQSWYNASTPATSRCPAAWAAVNVVLALGHRFPDQPTNDVELDVEDPCMARCVRNIQSVLPDLVTREEDLLGLQSMLGLVLLLMEKKDPRPANSLVATTVRLAHRLSAHGPDISMKYSDAENAQRSRVFWILYTVEKELCLRLQTPSVIDDNDIAIPLPPADPADGAGDLYYHAGSTASSAPAVARFNIFRSTVQLARVQGLIYAHLYSARSARLPIPVRRQRVAQIDSLLETWRQSLPIELQLGHLTRGLEPWKPGKDNTPQGLTRQILAHMAPLHLMHLRCFVMTHGIYSQNAGWIRRCISSYGRVALKDAKDPINGTCYEQLPPLPGSWARCVDFSRDCMTLITGLPKSDWSVWTMGCSYFSALLILLANIVERPDSPQAPSDQMLARPALDMFHVVLASSDWAPLQQLYIVLMEIDRAAVTAVRAVAESKMLGGPAGFQPVVRQEASVPSGRALAEDTDDWALAMDGRQPTSDPRIPGGSDMDLLGENRQHPFEGLDLDNLDQPEQWPYGNFADQQITLDQTGKTSDQLMAATFDMWSFGDHAMIDHYGDGNGAVPVSFSRS